MERSRKTDPVGAEWSGARRATRGGCRRVRMLVLVSLLMVGMVVPASVVAKSSHHRGPSPQIVGGDPVPNGTYPFIAAVLNLKWGKGAFRQQMCGGTLIDPSWVLTAAHCFARGKRKKKNVKVLVGRTNLDHRHGETSKVASIFLHPDYDPTTDNDDVALLLLKKPIHGVPVIVPVGANDGQFDAPGTELTVAGWGNTIAQPIPGGVLRDPQMQEVQLPVMADQDCNQLYGSIGIAITSDMLCAGVPDSGKDSCQGDSGGPLFADDANGFVQVGIVSFGEGCASAFPGVYSRLSAPAIANFISASVAASNAGGGHAGSKATSAKAGDRTGKAHSHRAGRSDRQRN